LDLACPWHAAIFLFEKADIPWINREPRILRRWRSCALAFARGGRNKNEKNNQCTYVLYLARIELLYTYDDVIFFIAFFSSTYRKTPKNALKKIGKEERKSTHDPVKLFYHVFEFPSPRGA
jgi:hypothetical protein